jgi:hypothetical protein
MQLKPHGYRRQRVMPDLSARVLAAICHDELYIFAHPGMRAEAEARFDAILAAMHEVSPS